MIAPHIQRDLIQELKGVKNHKTPGAMKAAAERVAFRHGIPVTDLISFLQLAVMVLEAAETKK